MVCNIVKEQSTHSSGWLMLQLMLKGAFMAISIPLIFLFGDCISLFVHLLSIAFTINLLSGCCARFFTWTSLPQPRHAPILPVAVRPESTQSSPACPAKCVGGNTEQQWVQSTVDIPQWKRQVRFQDCVDRMDGVGPHNRIDLHQRRGDVRKVANKKGHHDCTWKTKHRRR